MTEVFNDKSESPSDCAKHHQNKGACRAALIECEYRETTSPPLKRKKKTK